LSVTGSYAGAVGIAQFMPSNILLHGQDGNQDGHIDLFDHADAITSIASYLKYYGWQPGMTGEPAGKVIYHYNRSPYYVDTILKAAKLLKG
jgi:membrane-bound lytic murein transglycosylase B